MPALIYAAGGLVAIGLIGYGIYRVSQSTSAAQHAEEVKSEGLADAGLPQ